MGNVLTLSPPLTIDEADLQRGLEIVTTAIAEESKAAGLC
jgi:4-aminobutyrate aminotransferase-like enzyme